MSEIEEAGSFFIKSLRPIMVSTDRSSILIKRSTLVKNTVSITAPQKIPEYFRSPLTLKIV